MSPRAILLAASAIVAGMSAAPASALTPLSLDATYDLDAALDNAAQPAAGAIAAPQRFERRPDSEYEPTARVADARAHLQCVPFAREESGVQIRGDASTWWRQAKGQFETAAKPSERSVLVLQGYSDPNRGHVAVVKEVVSDRLIVVDHANWMNNGEITRDVPIRDVSRRGDWSQVQVWNIQTQQWGGRVYAVEGFILNLALNAKPPARG